MNECYYIGDASYSDFQMKIYTHINVNSWKSAFGEIYCIHSPPSISIPLYSIPFHSIHLFIHSHSNEIMSLVKAYKSFIKRDFQLNLKLLTENFRANL